MKFNMNMSKNTVFCLGLLLIVLFVSFMNIKEGGLFDGLEGDLSSAYNAASGDASSAYNAASTDASSAYNAASTDASSAYNDVTGTNASTPQPAANSSLLPDSSDTKSQPADATPQVKKPKGKGGVEKHNNRYSSYIAPAGDTVLYNKQQKQQKQHKQPIRPSNVPRHQIPSGDEDLYILKSEIVPPVCPACPNLVSCPNNNSSTPPPPCPPCGRCTEPAFECKKVPNYNSSSNQLNDFLPRPVLNNFSQFGM